MKHPRPYQLPSGQWTTVMLDECKCKPGNGPNQGICATCWKAILWNGKGTC